MNNNSIFLSVPVGGPTALGFAIRLFYLSCCFAPHMSSQTAIIGYCGSSYGDRYIHSLVVNHRRFTAFTSGYASVPTYGGNARITTNCYIPFLFALGNGNCPLLLNVFYVKTRITFLYSPRIHENLHVFFINAIALIAQLLYRKREP